MEAEQYILQEFRFSRTHQTVNSAIMMPVILYVYDYQYWLGLSDYFIEYAGFQVNIK